MIDQREKPLSEGNESMMIDGVLCIAAGETQRVQIDVSTSSSFSVRVDAGGTLLMIIAGAIDTDVSIMRRVELVGVGAKVELLAACKIAQGVTFRCDDDVRVSANGAECSIDDRCVALDGSKAIVRQCVVVDPEIIEATVETSVRGMLLGDGARIRAIPELHIASNMVRAKHGVSISRPTPAMTAYFASRGIDALTARTLIADQLLCPIGTQSTTV